MLLFDILKNRRTAGRRNPMFEQNRFAKIFIYIGVAFWAAYFIFIGIALSAAFKKALPNMEPYHLFNAVMFVFLACDFVFRFAFQKPPVQEIKPYILLPVSKKKVMSCFCLLSGISTYNFFWLFLIVPFGLLTIPRLFGLWGFTGFVVGYWLLFVMNNYWYLTCRTLIHEKILYLFVPILIYGLTACAEFLIEGNPISTFCMHMGEGFITGNIFSFLGLLSVIALLFYLNLSLQLHFAYQELGKTEIGKIKHTREMKFLDRFGEVGEYLRLEVRLQTRNKVPRSQFYLGLVIMLAFSLVLAFTQVYSGFMSYFILVYNFSVLGMMTLSQVMSYEGNYLDGLMSRKESILNILKSKYYWNCLLLVVPFIIMFIPVSQGKIHPMAPVTFLFFSAGCIFCTMFQLAVYNKKTLNMNMKVMGKNAGGTSVQTLVSFAVMLVPLLLIGILNALFNETVMYIILLMIGFIMTLLHPWWLRNVYQRFMKRRYANMDGFRNTR